MDVGSVEWRQRAQCFAMAAQMMRRILVDAARARHSHKRGGGAVHVNFESTAVLALEPEQSIIAVDEALTALSEIASHQTRVVELRHFGGLTEEEIATVLDIAPRTVRRDWEFSRARLARELAHSSGRQG